MVPEESLPGDLICILFGGQTPFVLREVEDMSEALREESIVAGGDGKIYVLIGESYIHGIMDGEACDGLKRREGDAEELLLQKKRFLF